jgi:hypothetical protein
MILGYHPGLSHLRGTTFRNIYISPGSLSARLVCPFLYSALIFKYQASPDPSIHPSFNISIHISIHPSVSSYFLPPTLNILDVSIITSNTAPTLCLHTTRHQQDLHLNPNKDTSSLLSRHRRRRRPPPPLPPTSRLSATQWTTHAQGSRSCGAHGAPKLSRPSQQPAATA